MKHKATSIIYYPTMLVIIVYILVSLLVLAPFNAGITLVGSLCALLIMLWILHKFLSEKGIMQVLLLLFLIFIQITLNSWLFTVIVFILLEVQLIAQYEIKRQITSFTFAVLPIIGVAFAYFLIFTYIGEKPEITNDDVQRATAVMEENPNVLDVHISADDSIICTLTIDEPLSLEDQEELGEDCARAVAEQIAPVKGNNNLGEVYNHYDLAMYVQLESKEDFYQGLKKKNNKRIKWNLHSAIYD